MRREGAAACSRAEGARSACDSACARDGAGDACRLGEGRGARGSRRPGGRGSAARCVAARGEGSAEATTRFERRALLLQKEVSELLEAGALLAADLAAAAVELKTKVKLDSAQINNCQLMFSLLFFPVTLREIVTLRETVTLRDSVTFGLRKRDIYGIGFPSCQKAAFQCRTPCPRMGSGAYNGTGRAYPSTALSSTMTSRTAPSVPPSTGPAARRR